MTCAAPKTISNLQSAPTEAKMAVRGTISSGAATLVDGLLYEALLFINLSHYGLAALAGALLGAVTNFSLNRHWTFVVKEGALARQVIRYAVVSGLTFFGLRAMLWLLVEVFGTSARLAWLPAKVVAFLAISYPLQRLWVFRGEHA